MKTRAAKRYVKVFLKTVKTRQQKADLQKSGLSL
jgi:hypothetical protein